VLLSATSSSDHMVLDQRLYTRIALATHHLAERCLGAFLAFHFAHHLHIEYIGICPFLFRCRHLGNTPGNAPRRLRLTLHSFSPPPSRC